MQKIGYRKAGEEYVSSTRLLPRSGRVACEAGAARYTCIRDTLPIQIDNILTTVNLGAMMNDGIVPIGDSRDVE